MPLVTPSAVICRRGSKLFPECGSKVTAMQITAFECNLLDRKISRQQEVACVLYPQDRLMFVWCLPEPRLVFT